EAFPLWSRTEGGGGSTYGDDDWDTVFYLDEDTVRRDTTFFTGSGSYGLQSIHWDGAVVATGEASLTGTSVDSAAFTAVDLTRSFALVTFRGNVGNTSHFGIRVVFKSTTQLTMDRAGSSDAATVRWHAIQLPATDLLQVEAVAVAFGTGDTQVDDTPATTLTDPDMAICVVGDGGCNSLGKGTYTADDDRSGANVTAYPQATTNVRSDRGTTDSYALDATVFLIEFVAAAAPTIEQEGFRFRADDGSESGASFLAAQDTDITRPKATNTRLRVLANATGDPASKQFQLEYYQAGYGNVAVPLT
ncbi:MAG: hypothetical protein ACHQ1G_00005, partial [Planctomycetota bacterium]